ncbi:hypothetical protein D0Y65_041230 [Glycine soja]|uniref:Uncharacterized protein n=1 Tax=Glycine soja TaxID=3848 RepID=A0A445GV53_GLYSO|nr:hypothetical protein D0Y65_041230 [Glycine soja]
MTLNLSSGFRVVRDFEGGLIVSALEGEFLAGANLVEDVPILLLQPSDLLHELILVEIELEFRLDLVIEQSGVVVVRGSSLRYVVEEPLQELDLLVVGPQPLKQSPRVIQRQRRRLFLRKSSSSTCILSNFTISAAPRATISDLVVENPKTLTCQNHSCEQLFITLKVLHLASLNSHSWLILLTLKFEAMVIDSILTSPRLKSPSFRRQFKKDELGSWSTLFQRHHFLLSTLVLLTLLYTIYLYFAVTLGASGTCSGLSGAQKASCHMELVKDSVAKGYSTFNISADVSTDVEITYFYIGAYVSNDVETFSFAFAVPLELLLRCFIRASSPPFIVDIEDLQLRCVVPLSRVIGRALGREDHHHSDDVPKQRRTTTSAYKWPRDPSVLTDYGDHVAVIIWNGEERPELKLSSHGRKVQKFGKSAPEIEGLVAATGLSFLIAYSVDTGDRGLISAFVESFETLHVDEAVLMLVELLEVFGEEVRAETTQCHGAYCWIYEHFPSVVESLSNPDYDEMSPRVCQWIATKASSKSLLASTYRKRLDGLTIADV